MKKTKDKRLLNLIVVLIFTAIIASALTSVIFSVYNESKIYDVKEINASFQTGYSLGFSADTSVLNFGIAPPGGTSTKEVILYHDYKSPLLVRLEYSGSIAQVLNNVEPFYLEPKISKTLKLTAHSISDGPMNYSGKVRIIFIKT